MNRLFLGAAAAAILISGCQTPSDTYTILVGTYGDAIHEIRYDKASGSFTETATIPARDASYLALDGNVLYAVSECGQDSGAYSFVDEGGWKQTAYLQGNGADPCFILALDSLVLTADYSGGSLTAFTKEDGIITGISRRIDYPSAYEGSGPVGNRQNSAHIHQVRDMIPGLLLVSDLGNDCIHILCRQDLSPIQDLPCGAGSGPRHMEYDPITSTLYCLTELSGEVVCWHHENGTFTEIQRIKADEADAAGSADIHLSPDGRFLYTSHRLDNDGICIFSVSGDGSISKVGYRHTGKHPRNFAITPDGTELMVACRDSHSIEVYRIDSSTGMLSECVSRQTTEADAPVCILFRQD